MTRPQASGALARFTVLDLTRVRSGPTCVRQLADWGANVIKIDALTEDAGSEQPGGPRRGADFQNLHRNKRAMTLNLKSERGQTMTEFALVLPIFVTLLFAILPFGIAFNNYVALTDAARAGARKGAVSRGSSNPAGACQNQVFAAATDLNTSQLQVTCSSPWSIGSDVTVDAQYPYSINLFGVVIPSGMLHSTVTERVE